MSRSNLHRFDFNTPMGVRRSVRLAITRVHQPQDSVDKVTPNHDLSRKRKFDQLDPETSNLSLRKDVVEEICSNCQQIDFEGAFQIDLKWQTHGVVVAELGRKGIEWSKSACSMCRLFAAVRVQPAGRPLSDISEYHLRALPFFKATESVFSGASLPEQIRKADSACFMVVSGKGRNRKVRLREQQSLTDLIRHSQPYGVISPIVSSATETPPRVGTRRLLPNRIDYHLLRNWYGFCAQNHRETCAIKNKEYPEMLKVIDCRTRRIVGAPPNCSYVALSYVWGKQQATTVSPFVISVKNSRHRTLSLFTIPRVIYDAMIVTLELGLQYLWIDRYCIDQNDKEKHFQINQMDKVYLCAVITIVAAAGESANYGLPGVSFTLRRVQPYAVVRGQLLASTMRNSQVAIGSSPWATRGWTYQEGTLSKRRLVFTDDQVFFECKGMSCSESHSVPLALLHRGKSKNRCGCISSIWTRFWTSYGVAATTKYWGDVARFTARELSYETDSLNAFIGVASYYKNGQESHSDPLYTHIGLPLDSDIRSSAEQPSSYGGQFVTSLLWEHGSQQVLPKRRRGFPSFSWAGWKGVASGPRVLGHFEPTARIVRDDDTNAEISTSLDTALDLEADTVQGQIEISETPDSEDLHPSFCLTKWEKSGQEHFKNRDVILPRDFLSRHKLSGGQTFFVDCVLIGYAKRYGSGKFICLMLIEYHRAIAERIGVVEFPLEEEEIRTLPKTRRRIRLG